MPSICTRPPTRTSANAWWIAAGTPDISSTTSTPSPSVWPSRRPRRPSGARCRARPSLGERQSRRGSRRDAMIRDAPAALQMPTAKMPIGPHPVTSTVAPGISAVQRRMERVPHRVVDPADLERNVVVEMPHVRRRHGDVLGEAAVAVDADDLRVRAHVPVAGAAQQAATVDDVSLGGHAIADLHVGDEATDARDVAGELVPDDERRLAPGRAPTRPSRKCVRRYRTRRRGGRGSALRRPESPALEHPRARIPGPLFPSQALSRARWLHADVDVSNDGANGRARWKPRTARSAMEAVVDARANAERSAVPPVALSSILRFARDDAMRCDAFPATRSFRRNPETRRRQWLRPDAIPHVRGKRGGNGGDCRGRAAVGSAADAFSALGHVPDAAAAAEPNVRELATLALDAAKSAGADYADVRFVRNRSQNLSTREQRVSGISDNETYGFGVRTLVNGAWGFAASRDLTREEVARVAKQAVAQARANRSALVRPVVLAPAPRRERHMEESDRDRSVLGDDRRQGRVVARGESGGARGEGRALRQLEHVLSARREDVRVDRRQLHGADDLSKPAGDDRHRRRQRRLRHARIERRRAARARL